MANFPSDTSPNNNSIIPVSTELCAKHMQITIPSPWIQRFAHLVKRDARVLDLAAGGGRHGRVLLSRSSHVTFIDKEVGALEDLEKEPKATVLRADVEGKVSPFSDDGVLQNMQFDAVIVVNYLFRPLLNGLIEVIAPGGILLYETFARGNEAFARPRNPDHLLKNQELLATVAGRMQIVAYEHGVMQTGDIPGVKQRICATKDLVDSGSENDIPPPICSQSNNTEPCKPRLKA